MGSLAVIFAGFDSTSIFTLRRRLRIGLVNIIELSSYLICVIVMVVWALISPSVWALVAGGLTNAACKMLASHFVPVGYHNRIFWEKQAARRRQSASALTGV